MRHPYIGPAQDASIRRQNYMDSTGGAKITKQERLDYSTLPCQTGQHLVPDLALAWA